MRIVLNASADRHTAVVESLSTYRGSGLNHVAFATDDIFAAVAELRERGVPLLHIPRNYYDDLEVRYDFDPAQIAHMREGGILYDRDNAGAEFFQVTRSSSRTGFSWRSCNARAVTTVMAR